MKISTVSININRDKQKNLDKYIKYIDEASSQGANLILFPEQSLQGYLTSVVSMDCSGNKEKNEFLYQYENAEIVPEGNSIRVLIEKAKEKNIYICFGMTEKDSEIDSKLYNTAVLVGPEGFVGKYRKVHQPADELHAYFGGKDFPVFNTKLGKIGMLICYDAWFPESGRELALKGANIILKPTATAHSFVEHDLEHDQAFYSYDLCEKACALNNGVYFISSNQIGICGSSDYFGHSNIIAPNGRIIESTGDEEKIIYYEIKDIDKDIYWGREQFAGLNFLKDRKPSCYTDLTMDNEFSNYK